MRRAALGQQAPAPHLARHAAVGAPFLPGGDLDPDIRCMPQPPARAFHRRDQRVVLPHRQGRHPAGRLVPAHRQGEAGPGMVAMTRRRVVRQGIDRMRQVAHRRPVGIHPVPHHPQPAGRRVLLTVLDDDPPSDAVRRGQRGQVGRHPVRRRPGIGIGAQQDTVRDAFLAQPGRALHHGAGPRHADIGLFRRQGKLQHMQAQRRMARRQPPQHRHRPVRAVVGGHHQPQPATVAAQVLPRQRGHQPGQRHRLVAGGNANDAAVEGKRVGDPDHVAWLLAMPSSGEPSRRSTALIRMPVTAERPAMATRRWRRMVSRYRAS